MQPALTEQQQQAIATAAQALREAAGDSTDMKTLLRSLVAETWPDLPDYSTLQHPEINEVATATVSTAVCPYFKSGRGEIMLVLPRAGTHYGYIDDGTPKYILFGGYVNMTHAPTAASDTQAGEQPREAAVRELGLEELKGEHGEQILHVRPERLLPTDSIMLYLGANYGRMSVQQFRFELTPVEVATIRQYADKIATDREFRHVVRAQTLNPYSNLPEICRTDIVSLSHILSDEKYLLYPGQMKFFHELSDQLTGAKAAGRAY